MAGRAAAGPARARAYEQARRHSRRVRFFKRAIPLAALTGIGIIGFLTFFDPFGRMAGVTLGPVSLSGTKITMENPRLAGYRKDNQPYEVTASVAMQDVRKPTIFELKDMKARVAADESGKMIRLVANFGVFDSTKEQLELREAVRVTTDDGQEARLHSAAVDFKAGTVVSREAVAITLPNGQVEADGIDINDGGKVISFIGNVRAVFEPPPPKSQEAATVPDAPVAKAEPPKPSPAKTSRAEPLSLRP